MKTPIPTLITLAIVLMILLFMTFAVQKITTPWKDVNLLLNGIQDIWGGVGKISKASGTLIIKVTNLSLTKINSTVPANFSIPVAWIGWLSLIIDFGILIISSYAMWKAFTLWGKVMAVACVFLIISLILFGVFGL